MKRIFGVLIGFLIAGFIGCLIFGFAMSVPQEAELAGKNAYKFCTAIQYFLDFLPALVFAGYSVSFAVYFGHNCESSMYRYSAAMVKRLQKVMTSAIACVLLLSLSNETFGILVQQKKTQIINRPGMINEYVRVAKDLYDQGFSKRAKKYAQAALALDPKSKEASEIYNLAEIDIKTENAKMPLFDSSANPVEEKTDAIIFDEQKVSKVYELLQKSKNAYKNENWFDAHYYAQQGLIYITAKDPNEDELKTLSRQAWANLTEVHNNAKTAQQLEFQEKYRGYVALVEKDDLKAYYIFKKLSENSLEGAKDPDVIFYLDVAQKRVEEKTFFIDETLELENFEDENNVYFSYTYQNGAKDIWFFKGVNTVQSSALTMQYIRDLYIVSFDKNGQFERSMHTAYAKVLPVNTDILDDDVKITLGIEKGVKNIPYILLKSVGRSDSAQVWSPEYVYPSGTVENKPEYMLYAMDFSEFKKLEQSSGSPSQMPLLTLASLAFKSNDYGFSQEMYGQIVLNRFLYPLFMLFMLILLASFAWNNRVGETQYFKFSWLISFPALIVALFLFYEIGMFVFRLVNYTLLISVKGTGALFAGIGVYLVFMIVSIVYFLSRKTDD